GTHADDEAGRRFEAKRWPRERALLLLEQAGEVDRPALPQVVARGEAVDRRGGDRECGALLELRAHLSRAALEQRVVVLEGDLASGVVDAVIGVACEELATEVDLFRAVPDLEAVERQLAAVARRRDAGVHAEREDRWGRARGRRRGRRCGFRSGTRASRP